MLVLIRGLPGSGKTELAQEYIRKGFFHVEADMFFLDDYGNYQYDRSKIAEAHDWCYQECAKHLAEGEDVVVSNTFVRQWEMHRYLKHNPEIVVATFPGTSVHDIADEKLEEMRKNWED